MSKTNSLLGVFGLMMMMKMFLVVTTFIASTTMIFQQPSFAKGMASGPIKMEQERIEPSTTNLPKLIRNLKRDRVYTPKMRALIKEALAFEKSLGNQTIMTKAVRKKLNAKARVLAIKYQKEVIILNRYINN